MKISKDEARLFAIILDSVKYDWVNNCPSKEEARRQVLAFEVLVAKLEKGGDDRRRYGRTSINWTSDLIKRIVNKYQPKT